MKKISDLVPGDVVLDGRIVISVQPSGDKLLVSTTRHKYLYLAADQTLPLSDSPPSPTDVAEYDLYLDIAAARKAWAAWNASLPELPVIEHVTTDEDGGQPAICPHIWTEDEAAEPHSKYAPRVAGQRCGADLSLHLDAYETATVYGWGESDYIDGPALLTGYGEDAESGDATSMSCINSHYWQVPNNRDVL